MNIETMVFIYIYVCACVLIFDVGFTMYSKHNKNSMPKRIAYLSKTLNSQITNYDTHTQIDQELQAKLEKKLKNISNLIGFMETIKEFKDKDKLKSYLMQSTNMFLSLANVYSKKASDQKAFLAYFLAELPINKVNGKSNIVLNQNIDDILKILLNFMNEDSVYIRENTFKAILNFGDHLYVAQAVEIINRNPAHQNEKLITDHLLAFKGDHEQLSSLLWKQYSTFSVILQVSFINYMRMLPNKINIQQEYCKYFYDIMRDKNINKEVRLAAIRYFRKHIYQDVFPLLVDFISHSNDNQWEYAAVSASTIGSYKSPQTIDLLKKSVSSRNWYVRFNAAESLLAMGIDVEKMMIDKGDAYANEMLTYRNQVSNLKRKKALV